MRVKGRKRSWIFHNLVMESHGKVMKFNRPEGAGTLVLVPNLYFSPTSWILALVIILSCDLLIQESFDKFYVFWLGWLAWLGTKLGPGSLLWMTTKFHFSMWFVNSGIIWQVLYFLTVWFHFKVKYNKSCWKL